MTPDQKTDTLRRAVAGGIRPVQTKPVDDEQLTLVALGRTAEMPAAERAEVLSAIAADVDLQATVAALRQAFAESAAEAAPTLQLTGSMTPTEARRPRKAWLRLNQGVFAAAAMLTLSLMVWTVMSPADPPPVGPGPGVTQENYVEQIGESRQFGMTGTQRNYLLLGAGVVTIIAGVPLVWLRLRQGRQARE